MRAWCKAAVIAVASSGCAPDPVWTGPTSMDPRTWCDPDDPVPDTPITFESGAPATLAPCGQILLADPDRNWTVTDTLAEPAFEAGLSDAQHNPSFSPNGRLVVLHRPGVVTVVDVYEGVLGTLAFDEQWGFVPRPSARAGMVAWTCRDSVVTVLDPDGARAVLEDIDCESVTAAAEAPVIVAFDREGYLVGAELETGQTYETAYNDAALVQPDGRERGLWITSDGRGVLTDIYDVFSDYDFISYTPVHTGIVELPNMQILYAADAVNVELSRHGHGMLLPPRSGGQRGFWNRDNEVALVPRASGYEVLDQDHVALIDADEVGEDSVAIWNARDEAIIYRYRPAHFQWINQAQDGLAEIHEIHPECHGEGATAAGCELGSWQLRLWIPGQGLGPMRAVPEAFYAYVYSTMGDILARREVAPDPSQPQRRNPDVEYLALGPDDRQLGRWVAPGTEFAPSIQFMGADERAAYLVFDDELGIGFVALDRHGDARQLWASGWGWLDARLRVVRGSPDGVPTLVPTHPPE